MKEHLRSEGFNDFLQKPFRPEELHRTIAQYSAYNDAKTEDLDAA